MKEYHKIDGLYCREPETKQLMKGVYRSEYVEYLKDCDWIFTEKIDGTNIRVVWDGHSVSFYGRTDKAAIPAHLLKRLEELFGGESNAQIFEEHFGSSSVILYGEGYGVKIQNGGAYRSDCDFILFDVEVFDDFANTGVFLKRDSVEEIATYFGIDCVPVIMIGKLSDAEQFVMSRPDSTFGTAKMESLVGHPVVDLRDRLGRRIIVKIKVRDYDEMEKYGK